MQRFKNSNEIFKSDQIAILVTSNLLNMKEVRNTRALNPLIETKKDQNIGPRKVRGIKMMTALQIAGRNMIVESLSMDP